MQFVTNYKAVKQTPRVKSGAAGESVALLRATTAATSRTDSDDISANVLAALQGSLHQIVKPQLAKMVNGHFCARR